jgi:MFS family permease
VRKTFGAGIYENMSFWGVDFKVLMVISQAVGYMISKFIGIKVVSESGSDNRGKGIFYALTIAMIALLGFGLTPSPYNLIFMFLNGLPLGMVWGLMFGYLEGRKFTEVLGASLSVSFIFASGFAKTVASFVMVDWGVSNMWMPFVASLLFYIPMLLFLWLLNKIPLPTAEDEALRTKRAPMMGRDRVKFALTFGLGLVLLVLTYTLLTVFRDLRDNFAADIWKELGYGDKPAIFTATELPVTIVVLSVIGSLLIIKNNYKAMIINHLIVLFGMILVGLSTLAFEKKVIDAPTWMVLVGMGLYFGYIQFNSTFFDRIIAAFKYVSTVGFLIYLADSVGYVGSMGVLIYRNFGQANMSWLKFFMSTGYVLSIAGSILITLSLFYFTKKYKSWSPTTD